MAKKKLKGFTLIEMIVVVALTVMLMACVFTILKPMKKIYNSTYEYGDSQTILDIVSRSIEDEVRYSNRLYAYCNVEPADETAFITAQLNQFRKDFYLNDSLNPGYTRISDADDTVYVMKISNPNGEDDLTSRGKVSRYVYEGGTLSSSSKVHHLVQEDIYDDVSRNTYYSLLFNIGEWDNTAGTFSAVSPAKFSFTVDVYKKKKVVDAGGKEVNKIVDTNVSEVISFALVNLGDRDAMFNETITVHQDSKPAGENDKVSPFRYKYYDHTTAGVQTGNDIYLIYTKAPNIEKVTTPAP